MFKKNPPAMFSFFSERLHSALWRGAFTMVLLALRMPHAETECLRAILVFFFQLAGRFLEGILGKTSSGTKDHFLEGILGETNPTCNVRPPSSFAATCNSRPPSR